MSRHHSLSLSKSVEHLRLWPGMDSQVWATRDQLHHIQLDVRQVQTIQNSHAERLLRLEKRQADDAALKSVWNSPFPSVFGGTPQHGEHRQSISGDSILPADGRFPGPVRVPSHDDLRDFEEQGHSLLGSLRLDADNEPTRRGPASRASGVRFDESALQASGWGGQGRHSTEIAPSRAASGLGAHAMERTYSYKSDGRHSSAGHSVHSFHSAASGRNSSLGLDTNFTIGADPTEDESPLETSGPPPGLFFLGTVPAIVRCWLDTNWINSAVLYAAICTGSHSSLLEYAVARKLGLADLIYRNADDKPCIKLAVYLAEASVTRPSSSSSSPAPQVPGITVNFEVTGIGRPEPLDGRKRIAVFVGSDALRLHRADLLFSSNLMTLDSNDHERLSVPFVRPEDESAFMHLSVVNSIPEKAKLNASAPEFVSSEARAHTRATPTAARAGVGAAGVATTTAESPQPPSSNSVVSVALNEIEARRPSSSPAAASQVSQSGRRLTSTARSVSDRGREDNKHAKDTTGLSRSEATPHTDNTPRETNSTVWGSTWRHNGAASESCHHDNASSYQPAGRTARPMKVLGLKKPTSLSQTRPGPTTTESPWLARAPVENRPRGPTSSSAENSVSGSRSGSVKLDSRRSFSTSQLAYDAAKMSLTSTAPRSTNNPLGGASAFAWMGQSTKPKTAAGAVE